jgi:capping protein beta
VYLWEPVVGEGEAAPPAGAFAGCFLVHKGEGSDRHGGGVQRGYWDAIHVAEALPGAGDAATYKLTSTVSLFLRCASAKAGDAAADGPHAVGGAGSVQLAGSLTRTATSSGVARGNAGGAHLVNLGKLIEETENKLRATIDAVYFGKTRSVVAQLRAASGEMAVDRRESLQTSLVTDMLRRSGVQPGGPGVGMMGMMGGPPGLGAAFDPKAALAGLRKKPAPAAEGAPADA